MNQETEKRLAQAGIQVQKGMERFLNNEALFARFLKKFPEDPNFAKLREAFAAGDREAATAAAHTLKGVCGNLSMDTLFALFDWQVKLLRQDAWEEAEALMPELEAAYEKVKRAIAGSGL